MNKVLILVASTLGSGVGWWIGDFVGLEMAVVLGCVGTLVGVYVGWRLSRNYTE